MDRGQRGITAGDGWQEMDPVRRWIAAWYGSRPDTDGWPRWMTGDGWQEMDLMRWIKGDRWQSVSFLYEGIDLMQSYTILEITTLISSYEVTSERRYPDIRCIGSMAPPCTIPSTIQSTIQRYRNMQLHAWVPKPNTILTQPRWSQVTQLQCRYRTSWSRTILVFGGATISNEGDDSAGTTTTPTANNYRTGSAGTKRRETHSPIGKASSCLCMQGSDGKRTYRLIKKPHVQVTISNEILNASRQSRHSLGNPDIHGCYGLLVGRATTHKQRWPYRHQKQPLPQAITVPEVLGGNTLECTYRQRIAAGD